jgi:hypothetical protein
MTIQSEAPYRAKLEAAHKAHEKPISPATNSNRTADQKIGPQIAARSD